MLKTPLFDFHVSAKARMVEFAGYEMPVMYQSVKEEYLAVREKSGLFDISHMAPIHFKGPAVPLLESLTCRKISDIALGQVQYNALIYPAGGVVDDITVYKLAEEDYLVIANASNRKKVMDFIHTYSPAHPAVKIEEIQNYILLAIQGPYSQEKIKPALAKINCQLPDIYYYECARLPVSPYGIISRTGYTGEDGYEVLLPLAQGQTVWSALVEGGSMPCGLASRDVLRMEVFYPLYGHELHENQTPFEGGIGWAVDLDKEFLGKEAVQKHATSLPGRVRGFVMEEEGIPRQDFKLYSPGGEEAGVVTSGAFSFLWNKGFGLAYVKSAYSKPGTILQVDIRGKKKNIKLHGLSPYKGSICRRPQ